MGGLHAKTVREAIIRQLKGVGDPYCAQPGLSGVVGRAAGPIPLHQLKETNLQDVPRASLATRWAVGVASAACLLTALASMVVAAARGDQPYWLMQQMEATIVVASIVGLLFARGRFQNGPGMALLCVAGVFGAAGFLSWLSVRQGVSLRGGTLWPTRPGLLVRVGASGILCALAAWEVLRRNPRSLGYLGRAIAAGVPLVLILGAMYLGRNALAGESGMPTWLAWTLSTTGGMATLVLFCACAHCTIRAFELGRPQAPQSAPPAPNAATPGPGARSS